MTAEEIRERVRAEGLIPHDGVLVAMLSGGRDSVCLLDVLVELCGAERVWALHINYGLRPDADADEQHCRELCERLGVQLEVVHPGGADGPGGNLHAWARELRYRAAGQLASRLGAMPEEADEMSAAGSPRARGRARAWVATGHTSTDQVETILYRLAASPGRRALLGMARREGRLVRPLLGVTREQTAAYCRERGLAWREDLSNDDPRYARARVRHGLGQALMAVHPAAFDNVLRTVELLREETELLEGLVDAELGGLDRISIERLRGLPAALQRLIAIRLAEDAAGTLVPQAGERVREMLALADRGGRSELHVGGLVSAVVEDGTVRMVRIAARRQHPQVANRGQRPSGGGQ
jgi:tRNA(Ile)-lysidine synthase